MHPAISKANTKAFQRALLALNERPVPYVIGGAFAMYEFSGMWRNTNDLDLYIERKHISEAAKILSEEGFHDFGEMAAGDREWIYHSTKDGTMVDLIWQPPNHMASIDESFIKNGMTGDFLGVRTCYMSPSDLIWTKLFVVNRQRCDWPDIFHIVRSPKAAIDWEDLLKKVGAHWQVMLSFIILFDWVYPSEMGAIPQHIRKELLDRKRNAPLTNSENTQESLLDPWIYTRPFFI